MKLPIANLSKLHVRRLSVRGVVPCRMPCSRAWRGKVKPLPAYTALRTSTHAKCREDGLDAQRFRDWLQLRLKDLSLRALSATFILNMGANVRPFT